MVGILGHFLSSWGEEGLNPKVKVPGGHGAGKAAGLWGIYVLNMQRPKNCKNRGLCPYLSVFCKDQDHDYTRVLKSTDLWTVGTL